MTNRWLIPLLLALPLPAAAQSADKPTYAQVQAVFSKHCVSCHNAKDEEGELVLESYATLMKGGEDGPVVVAGKSDQSLLLKLIRREKKPYMPPPKKGDKLSDAEIELIRAWIDAGAPAGEPGSAVAAQPAVVLAAKAYAARSGLRRVWGRGVPGHGRWMPCVAARRKHWPGARGELQRRCRRGCLFRRAGWCVSPLTTAISKVGDIWREEHRPVPLQEQS